MSDDNEEDKESPIDKSLGLPGSTHSFPDIVGTIVGQITDESANEDFKYTRAKIREAIEIYMEAIADLGSLAKQSQSVDAYDSLNSMLANMVKSNRQLIEIQKRKHDIRDYKPPVSDNSKTTNNLYVGTTEELQKLLKK